MMESANERFQGAELVKVSFVCCVAFFVVPAHPAELIGGILCRFAGNSGWELWRDLFR